MTKSFTRALVAIIAAVLGFAGWSVADAGMAHATSTCSAVKNHKNNGTAQIPSSSSSSVSDCQLTVGNSGAPVRALQNGLNTCYKAGLVVDGKFGPNTRTALIKAQRSANTSADGIFGPKTQRAIKWPYHVSGALPTCKKFNGDPWA